MENTFTDSNNIDSNNTDSKDDKKRMYKHDSKYYVNGFPLYGNTLNHVCNMHKNSKDLIYHLVLYNLNDELIYFKPIAVEIETLLNTTKMVCETTNGKFKKIEGSVEYLINNVYSIFKTYDSERDSEIKYDPKMANCGKYISRNLHKTLMNIYSDSNDILNSIRRCNKDPE